MTPETMSLEEAAGYLRLGRQHAALALADHDSPLPHLAGDALRVLRAELERRPAIPAGWKLVPVELTPEMCDAFAYAPACDSGNEELRLAWAGMIAAAPTPPAAEPEASAPAADLRKIADDIQMAALLAMEDPRIDKLGVSQQLGEIHGRLLALIDTQQAQEITK